LKIAKKIASTCLLHFLREYLYYLKKEEKKSMSEIVRECLNKKKSLVDFNSDFSYRELEIKKEVKVTFYLEEKTLIKMQKIKTILPGLPRAGVVNLCLLFKEVTVDSLLEALKGRLFFLSPFYCELERFSLNERFSLLKGRQPLSVRLTPRLNQACDFLQKKDFNLSRVARTCLKSRVSIDDYLNLFDLYLNNLDAKKTQIRSFNLDSRTIYKMDQINELLKSFSKTVCIDLCLLFKNLTIDGFLQRIKGEINKSV
jgi:predicted CopG family antitoxin